MFSSGGPGEFDPEALKNAWQAQFRAVLGRQGEDICIAAYEGFERKGKGAIMINVDDDKLEEQEVVFKTGGEIFLSSPDNIMAEELDERRREIVQMINEYNPDSEFVLIFTYMGLIGVQTVKPKFGPRYMFDFFKGKR